MYTCLKDINIVFFTFVVFVAGNISAELLSLDLSHNSLVKIDAKVFSDMPKLTSLKLNNNK